MAHDPQERQLKETSQLTGALCAAWLEHNVEWEILAAYKLAAKDRNAVLKFVDSPELRSWINGALTGNRSRSRSAIEGLGLAGRKLYIFPDQMTQRVILVGADNLSSIAQRFWRVVAVGTRAGRCSIPMQTRA